MKKWIFISSGVVIAILVVIALMLPSSSKTTRAKIAVKTYPIVSMGDSVAAGDGLPELSSKTASLCHQSNESYPYVLATLLHTTLYQFACSGAQISVGILGPQTVGSQTVPAQLTTAKPYIAGSDVTITIGANDVGWSNLLITCAQTSCATADNLALFQGRITAMQTQLNLLLNQLTPLQPHTVLLNTYYNLIASSDTCMQQFGITTAKIEWINAREATLNAAIAAAATAHHDAYTNVTFGDDHDICSSDPWIQGLTGSAPLHPTIDGQATIASYDQAKLQ
jgi:lysophospholipase L1-like esterase